MGHLVKTKIDTTNIIIKYQYHYIMKTNILILALSLTVVGCNMGEKEKPIKNEQEVLSRSASGKTPKCDTRMGIPADQDELNRKAPLVYNLADDCRFQPMHVQIRDFQASSELIARFYGKKINSDTFALDSIQFKYFEIGAAPRPIKVDRVVFDAPLTQFQVYLMDDQSGSKKEIDFTLREKITLSKKALVDVKIENESAFYTPPFRGFDFDIPRGKQCNGRTFF